MEEVMISFHGARRWLLFEDLSQYLLMVETPEEVKLAAKEGRLVYLGNDVPSTQYYALITPQGHKFLVVTWLDREESKGAIVYEIFAGLPQQFLEFLANVPKE